MSAERQAKSPRDVPEVRKSHVRASSAPIPFHRAWRTGRELAYLEQAIHGRLDGDRAFGERCRSWLEGYLGAPVLLTPSCTGALEMAALLLRGDPSEPAEVIVPSFTFASTVNAFVLHGYRPVFVDVRPEDGTMDPARVAEAITEHTRVVVPVHYAGATGDLGTIVETARSNGVAVVEDAAQALFARYRDRPAGTIGDIGVFSFHDTKNVSCGEGGAIVFRRRDLLRRAEHIRDKGTDRSMFIRGEVDKYTWVDLGGSYLPSELQAAFLLAQLEGAGPMIRRRAKLVARYRRGLAPLEARGRLELPRIDPDCESAHHIFFVVLPDPAERPALLRWLDEHRIGATTHFVPLHATPMGRQLGAGEGALPVTERFAASIVRLPLHPSLTDEDVDTVVDVVSAFFGS
jgi:dTDP-4-amino-4,6-dideoxygalactose transaminase